MSDEVLRKYVEQAETAAESVKDKELKLKAFTLVLNHLLAGTPAAAPTSKVQAPGQGKATAVPTGDDPIERIAAWAQVDADAISDVMTLDDGKVNIHIASSALPKKGADAQRFLALVQLAATKAAFGQSDVGAKELIATCTDYSCMDANFAKNLKAYDKYIAVKGSKGKMKVYSIRRPGLEKAAEEIRNVLSEA